MRILVNGDGHTAAAHAVVPYEWADQDPAFFYLGHAPHPANAEVGWSRVLARTLKAVVHNESESGNNNQTIMSTTLAWLAKHSQTPRDVRVLIQWAPWQDQDLELIHREIWDFHTQLMVRGLDHVFMNGDDDFSQIATEHRYDWGSAYIGAYQPEMTVSAWLKSHNHATVSAQSRFFDARAHADWARFVLQYGIQHNIWN